jgi:hypothetical protein
MKSALILPRFGRSGKFYLEGHRHDTGSLDLQKIYSPVVRR